MRSIFTGGWRLKLWLSKNEHLPLTFEIVDWLKSIFPRENFLIGYYYYYYYSVCIENHTSDIIVCSTLLVDFMPPGMCRTFLNFQKNSMFNIFFSWLLCIYVLLFFLIGEVCERRMIWWNYYWFEVTLLHKLKKKRYSSN